MGYYGYGSHMFGWGVFGAIMSVLVWVVIIVVIVALVRRLVLGRRWMGHHGMHGMHGMTGSGSAMETLRQRYAKGEINKEEFEQKKKDLAE